MTVCILGNGLTALTLAKTLVNKNIYVDLLVPKKEHKLSHTRTLGISKTNSDFFNRDIISIEKLLWKLKRIEIFSENLKKEKLINFENKEDQLFSMIKNYQLYEILKKSLKKNKFLNYKKNYNFKHILKHSNNLVINCDPYNEISKKFFSNKIKKNYSSIAYTTIINHKKISKNNTAIQIFTNKGPIAFLPISNNKTSIVYSYRESNNKKEVDINSLIKKFNPKYKILSIENLSKFKLTSSNLRKYYQGNIMAFGDLLHKIHPLAGQGFNMSIRDISKLIKLIENRINLGLDLDHSICFEFQKETKDKNYIFTTGVDLIYEFFNFESKFKSNFLNKTINLVGKNRSLNTLFKKIADVGI